MKSILTLAFTFVWLLVNAQTTIEFRILSVSSNVADLDGFLQGDSDPVWEFEILDGGTSLGDDDHSITENCPGTKTINNTFASRNYNCAFPANFTFRWRGYEDDGILGTDANTGLQTIVIPSGGLTATTFTNIATYTANAAGDNCSGGSSVTWGITLQYRVSGSFLLNTAPTAVNASSLLVQTGHSVNLAQVGGTTSVGSAVFNWYTGSCNGTFIGTGATISPTVSGTTTYYVKSVGTCVTTCASITINSSALGVSLSDYYYLCQDDQLEFHWQTESETDNSHFLIEQMVSENTWESVTEIKGYGNSSITRHYTYELPNSTSNNDRYYRLVQVDKNGTRTTYDPFYASCEPGSKALTIYPNPNNGSWAIYPFESDLQIRSVRNTIGKLVHFEVQDGNIQLTNPEAGTYFVETISKGQVSIQKVIVE